MTLINGDKIITAQLYDDEYEEFTEKKMSIIDFVNAYTDEGVTTADDVLDKIRAEIEQLHLIGYATVDVLVSAGTNIDVLMDYFKHHTSEVIQRVVEKEFPNAIPTDDI